MEYRVRQLIPYIDYTNLVRIGVIPSDIFSEHIPKQSFPSFVQKQRCEFGCFVEELVMIFLQDLKPTEDFYSELLAIAKEVNLKCTLEDIEKYNKLWWKIFHFTQKKLKEFNPQALQELRFNSVIGHPDLLCKDIVFDIKTTSSFTSMRIETILQLLCYAALSKRKLIGVVLPLNARIITYYLENWDQDIFLTILHEITDTLTVPLFVPQDILTTVGSHVAKGKGIYNTLLKLGRGFAVQMFLSSPRGNTERRANSTPKITESDIKSSRNFIRENDIKFFTHAPYYLNLARKCELSELPYEVKILLQELEITRRIGGKGVIVHVGSALHFDSQEEALEQMKNMVQLVVDNMKTGCLLLIETACGEGQELLSDVHDLLQFVKQFPRDKVQICVDTCHSFCAGHCPLQVLHYLGDYTKLIHFNDSETPKGSHTDRHASPGQGKIGLDLMIRCLLYAQAMNIPCVTE